MDGFEATTRELLAEYERFQALDQAELTRLMCGDAWRTICVDEDDVARLVKQIKNRADRILLLGTILVKGAEKNARAARKAEQ